MIPVQFDSRIIKISPDDVKNVFKGRAKFAPLLFFFIQVGAFFAPSGGQINQVRLGARAVPAGKRIKIGRWRPIGRLKISTDVIGELEARAA